MLLVIKLPSIPKNILIASLVGILVGAGLVSVFWVIYYNRQISQHKNSTGIEINQLREQAQSLRDEKFQMLNPSPTPTLISLPYVKNENLTGNSIYSLDCIYPGKNKPTWAWYTAMEQFFKQKVESDVVHVCYNSTLNQALVLLSKEIKDYGGFGHPSSNEFTLRTYDPISSSYGTYYSSQRSYLGGWCNSIVAWSKTNSFYIKCGGGDGPWSSESLIRIDQSNYNKVGIVQSCYTFANKTTCNTYCDSQTACKTGYICNLEKNTCMQSCKTDSDCTNSACKPSGANLVCQ